MPSIGRNAPCPCGSGKKYKQCHGPIDAEREAAQRTLKRAGESLLPKLMKALDRFGIELPAALNRFWNGAYSVQDIQELDDLEDRGSERFLTWFAFDAEDDQGQTPAQRLAADPQDLELTEAETQVLAGWGDVRLQPYVAVNVRKGQGLRVRPLFGRDELDIEDHAASRRVEADEVLIAHLVPVANTNHIAGAAAQLTPDTIPQLTEFVEVHLEDLRRSLPDATYADLIHSRSEIFNHFVMALPREQHDVGKLSELVAMTRATLNVTASQIGFGGKESEGSIEVPYDLDGQSLDETDDAEPRVSDDPDLDADSDANVPSAVGDTAQTLETGGVQAEGTETRSEGRSYDGVED